MRTNVDSALFVGQAVARATMQLGLRGEMTLPVNTIVANEFDLRGALRFHEEFAVAVELLNKKIVESSTSSR